MKYSVNEKNSKPAYIQLYEQLRSDITTGILTYGSKLPSKRIFAEESGVSVIIVLHPTPFCVMKVMWNPVSAADTM